MRGRVEGKDEGSSERREWEGRGERGREGKVEWKRFGESMNERERERDRKKKRGRMRTFTVYE